MYKTLILMQGIPGSGKSTIAAKLSGVIFSTDSFWTFGPGNTEPGKYTYDPERIYEAHMWNQRQVAMAMAIDNPPIDTIIVDNTNIKQEHVDPYLTLARMFNYAPQVVRVECPIEVALLRQISRSPERRIPPDVIVRMHDEMERLVV